MSFTGYTEAILRECRIVWRKRGSGSFFRFHFGPQTFVEGFMARITTEEQVGVVVVPKTAAGRTAPIDGEVTFSSSDTSVATVTPTGPNSAVVKAVAKGATQIIATFDADLDVGEVRTIELSGAIEVVDAEAVTGVLTFGAPEVNPDLNTVIGSQAGSVTPGA